MLIEKMGHQLKQNPVLKVGLKMNFDDNRKYGSHLPI
jgi:hypothetical protein